MPTATSPTSEPASTAIIQASFESQAIPWHGKRQWAPTCVDPNRRSSIFRSPRLTAIDGSFFPADGDVSPRRGRRCRAFPSCLRVSVRTTPNVPTASASIRSLTKPQGRGESQSANMPGHSTSDDVTAIVRRFGDSVLPERNMKTARSSKREVLETKISLPIEASTHRQPS